MELKCTCEVYAWPDCRYDNQHCPKHYDECGCPETSPSDGRWCRFVRCPRKEKHATEWRLFVPEYVSEHAVRILVEKAGGTFQDKLTYCTDSKKTAYFFEGSRAVAKALLSIDKNFEACPQ